MGGGTAALRRSISCALPCADLFETLTLITLAFSASFADVELLDSDDAAVRRASLAAAPTFVLIFNCVLAAAFVATLLLYTRVSARLFGESNEHRR